jgi:ribosomal protein S18 acetylase RimI-like enzyme
VAQIEIKTHRERTIPPRSVRELYEHVSWSRPANEEELREVLEAGPAVGAWDGERLVGFVRALSDGHLAAYIEDVMVHQDYRRGGVGDRLMSRLLGEIKQSANVSLSCERPVVRFYERHGFRATSYVLMQRSVEEGQHAAE